MGGKEKKRENGNFYGQQGSLHACIHRHSVATAHVEEEEEDVIAVIENIYGFCCRRRRSPHPKPLGIPFQERVAKKPRVETLISAALFKEWQLEKAAATMSQSNYQLVS